MGSSTIFDRKLLERSQFHKSHTNKICTSIKGSQALLLWCLTKGEWSYSGGHFVIFPNKIALSSFSLTLSTTFQPVIYNILHQIVCWFCSDDIVLLIFGLICHQLKQRHYMKQRTPKNKECLHVLINKRPFSWFLYF